MINLQSIIYTIFFFAAFHGLVLGMILIFRKDRNKNLFLSLILIFFSLSIIIHSLSDSLKIKFISIYHPVFIQLLLINLGPFMYLYLKRLTLNGYKFKKRELLHFIPFLLSSLFLIFLLIFIRNNELREVIKELPIFILLVVIGIYLIFSKIRLIRYLKEIKNNFSFMEKINLRWMNFLLYILIVFLVFSFAISLFLPNLKFNGNIIWLGSSFIIYIIGYFGLLQPEIFVTEERNINNDEIKIKYAKLPLSEELKEKYYKKLISTMSEKKLYLNNDLSLPVLARELNIPIHHLSRIINEKLNQNFYDYINFQRINEAKLMLMENSAGYLSIASIGLDSGFNSLSAFNAAFKKITGMTPSDYRNNINKTS